MLHEEEKEQDSCGCRSILILGSPGSYQRLDLFMKVLRVLCPNLTDDPEFSCLLIFIADGNIENLIPYNYYLHQDWFSKDKDTFMEILEV